MPNKIQVIIIILKPKQDERKTLPNDARTRHAGNDIC